MHDTWNTVPNIINYNNINENGGKNKDGAKIYVGWANLIIGILPGPKKYFRDAEGSSGLTTGGEQFCNYFLARAKPLTQVAIGIFLKKAISSALGTGVRRGAI